MFFDMRAQKYSLYDSKYDSIFMKTFVLPIIYFCKAFALCLPPKHNTNVGFAAEPLLYI